MAHFGQLGVILNSAINGSAIAEVSSAGLDFKDMVNFARNVGSPALAKYTFHERALMLKKLGAYLIERKELFYECSKATAQLAVTHGLILKAA